MGGSDLAINVRCWTGWGKFKWLLLTLTSITACYEGENEIPLVPDPVNCLFSITISPNIEPVCCKMCGVVRLSRLADEII